MGKTDTDFPLRISHIGAEGRTRTGTACATAPSRRRVYQFHHFGNIELKVFFHHPQGVGFLFQEPWMIEERRAMLLSGNDLQR